VLTRTQKQTAEAIINVFETGEVRGDYGRVTVLPGDRGHLSFGRAQTTLGSGNLHVLLQRYCAAPGACFARRLADWLPAMAARDTTLDQDSKLHNVLRASADDDVMRDVQDDFFDECFWQPAERRANIEGIRTPLGVALVYDGFVQGSWKTVRDLTNQHVGSLAALGEERWLSAYVATRRRWLANHPRPILRDTVYRMDAFQRLIDQGYWNLELPLVVRDQEISMASLSALPRGC
jgi:chitosanase